MGAISENCHYVHSPFHHTCDVYVNREMYLQELEQEKYHLRRRLEVAEEEYELKVSELHSDITVSHCEDGMIVM